MVTRKKYLWMHPNGRWYVRIEGKYHPTRATEGTQDFDGEYWAIVTGQRAEARTFSRALITDYRKSDRWTGLKPRTRADYDKVLAYIEEKAGDRDVKALTRADVIAAQKTNGDRTRFANYVVQIFVVLCEHAIDLGWIERNPAKGVRTLKTPNVRRHSHVPWPDTAVERLRAESAPLPRLIFEIGVGTVQRPSDWTSLAWGDYDPAGDGTLRLRQGKTGQSLLLPCSEFLSAAREAEKVRLGFVPIASYPILCSPQAGG